MTFDLKNNYYHLVRDSFGEQYAKRMGETQPQTLIVINTATLSSRNRCECLPLPRDRGCLTYINILYYNTFQQIA